MDIAKSLCIEKAYEDSNSKLSSLRNRITLLFECLSFPVTEYSLGELTPAGDDIGDEDRIRFNLLFSIISDIACSTGDRNYSQSRVTHSRIERI
jgi:hypothetical protein